MNWIVLVIAGLCECGFTFSLGNAKTASGGAKFFWYAMFAVFCILSMYLLVKAVRHLPVGTAYAVWTGIGSVGTALIGMLFFHEPATFWRIFFISTLIMSIVGLKLVS